jgi:hypothetical protein
MTHEPSRIGKSRQSGFVGNEKIASSMLLAAVSILSVSLGVTASQSAVTVAGGSSTRDLSVKLAETKTTVHTNELKMNPPVSQKPVSKGMEYGKRPVDYSPPPPPGPQEKPKR